MFLLHPRAEDGQLVSSKLLLQFKESGPFFLISGGRSLADIGLVHRTLQLIGHVVPRCKDGNSLRETDVFLLHANVDGAHGRAAVTEVSDLVAVVVLLEAGGSVVLVGTALEFLLVVYTSFGLRIVVEDDVQPGA